MCGTIAAAMGSPFTADPDPGCGGRETSACSRLKWGCTMPRYFFHLRDAAGTLLDIEGSEHADLDAATAQAVRHARGLIVDDVQHRGQVPLGERIDITDAAATVLATVVFADTVTLTGGAKQQD